MAPTVANPKHSTTKPRRQEGNPGTAVVRAKRAPQRSTATEGSAELPSRQALTSRLEAQRQELLRAMSGIGLAQRTLEEHVAGGLSRVASPINSEEQEFYRQRVLDALHDAAEALRTAYPMLERIAHALAVDEILKQHAPEQPRASAAGRPRARE